MVRQYFNTGLPWLGFGQCNSLLWKRWGRLADSGQPASSESWSVAKLSGPCGTQMSAAGAEHLGDGEDRRGVGVPGEEIEADFRLTWPTGECGGSVGPCIDLPSQVGARPRLLQSARGRL